MALRYAGFARAAGSRSWLVCVLVLLTVLPGLVHAVPAFNRQTGQNCVACHAGGPFPELTAYGRLFKMTGYTMP